LAPFIFVALSVFDSCCELFSGLLSALNNTETHKQTREQFTT
jgi:hypothetical protein